jgi:hypothetical protein
MPGEGLQPNARVLAADPDVDKEMLERFRDEVESLAPKLDSIQSLVEPLLSPRAASPGLAKEVETRLARSGALPLLILCTTLPADQVGRMLDDAAVPTESANAVKRFADRFRSLGDLFARAGRADQGYENEITSVSSRPTLFLRTGTVTLDLEVYSHDKLLFRSREDVGELVKVIALFLRHVCGALERARDLDQKLASGAVDPEVFDNFSTQADRLAELVRPSPATQEASEHSPNGAQAAPPGASATVPRCT